MRTSKTQERQTVFAIPKGLSEQDWKTLRRVRFRLLEKIARTRAKRVKPDKK